jgi:hypothetical protein
MTRDQLLRYYRSLTPAERIDLLVEQERVKAQLEADQQALLAVVDDDPACELGDGREALDKHFVRDEVACALRLSFETARSRLVQAQQLVHRFPAAWQVLAAGRIGFLHCRNLVEATGHLDDDTALRVAARVLPRAAEQTPAEFRRAVKRAVAALDPAGETERHDAAAERRRVVCSDEPDGMASVYAYLTAAGAQVLMTCLDAAAGRRTDERSMDQRRADALVDLAADGLDRVPSQHGRKPAVQVSVALSTLLGLDDQPGELAGYGPIPATVARTIAADPTGTWIRLVTDPLGRLVDLGCEKYRPPQNLADFVVARDQTCRMPGCHRKACTCELDHVLPHASGGPTSAANLHALCCRHHHVKHEAGWQVRRTENGSTVWLTPTGRTYEKPPATYPIDHTADPPHLAA